MNSLEIIMEYCGLTRSVYNGVEIPYPRRNYVQHVATLREQLRS